MPKMIPRDVRELGGIEAAVETFLAAVAARTAGGDADDILVNALQAICIPHRLAGGEPGDLVHAYAQAMGCLLAMSGVQATDALIPAFGRALAFYHAEARKLIAGAGKGIVVVRPPEASKAH